MGHSNVHFLKRMASQGILAILSVIIGMVCSLLFPLTAQDCEKGNFNNCADRPDEQRVKLTPEEDMKVECLKKDRVMGKFNIEYNDQTIKKEAKKCGLRKAVMTVEMKDENNMPADSCPGKNKNCKEKQGGGNKETEQTGCITKVILKDEEHTHTFTFDVCKGKKNKRKGKLKQNKDCGKRGNGNGPGNGENGNGNQNQKKNQQTVTSNPEPYTAERNKEGNRVKLFTPCKKKIPAPVSIKVKGFYATPGKKKIRASLTPDKPENNNRLVPVIPDDEDHIAAEPGEVTIHVAPAEILEAMDKNGGDMAWDIDCDKESQIPDEPMFICVPPDSNQGTISFNMRCKEDGATYPWEIKRNGSLVDSSDIMTRSQSTLPPGEYLLTVTKECPNKGKVKCFRRDIEFTVVDVDITSNAEVRSFSPSTNSLSGIETLQADPEPDLSETGGTLEWKFMQESNATATLWDDQTGEVKFQEDDGSGWTNEVTGDDDPNVNMRVNTPGRAIVKVIYRIGGESICMDSEQISVPQFVKFDFTVNHNGTFNGDLQAIGLRNPNIGTDPDEITAFRNAFVRLFVQAGVITTSRNLYDDINVRFTASAPTFLAEDKITDANIAGQPNDGSGFGSLANDPADGPCETEPTETAATLDVGNRIPDGLVCVFSGRHARTSIWDAGPDTHDETFDPIIADPISNDDFITVSGFPVIIRPEVNTAINRYSTLVGSTLSHETGHALGLVPGTVHNPGNGGHLMDTGGNQSWSDRIGPNAFNGVNQGRLQGVLAVPGVGGFN